MYPIQAQLHLCTSLLLTGELVSNSAPPKLLALCLAQYGGERVTSATWLQISNTFLQTLSWHGSLQRHKLVCAHYPHIPSALGSGKSGLTDLGFLLASNGQAGV